MSESLKELLDKTARASSNIQKLRKTSGITLISAIVALQSLLATAAFLDTLHLIYYPTIHRLTMPKMFNLGFNLIPFILLFSGITSAYLFKEGKSLHVLLPAFSWALAIFFPELEVSATAFSILITIASIIAFRNLREYVFWLLAFVTGFETLALSHWIIFKPSGLPSPTIKIANLELELFFVVARLAPLITLPTLYMWLIKPAVKLGVKAANRSSKVSSGEDGLTLPLRSYVLLASAVVLAVVSAIYPYIPSINREYSQVGADVPGYVSMVEEIWEDPLKVNLARPWSITSLLIYGFGRASGLGVSDAVRYFPLLLNPLLTASVYFMVFEAVDNKWLASLSSMFTTLGFVVTVGMFSYFLANMLSLCLIFAALGFLFKAFRRGSLAILSLACVLGSLVTFTHPWTFAQYYAGVGLTLPFLAFKCLKTRKIERSLTYTLIYLVVTGFVDVLKGFFLGLGGYSAASSTQWDIAQISNFWNNNLFCFTRLYGGLLPNVVLLGVAAAGAYSLNHGNQFELFLTLLSAASSVYYPFTDGMTQSRLLYNIPFGVLAAFAAFKLLNDSNISRKIRITAFVFLTAHMLVYLFRSLANLV